MSNTLTSDLGELSAPGKSTDFMLDQVEQSRSRIIAQVTQNASDGVIEKMLEYPTILEHTISYSPGSKKEISELAGEPNDILKTQEESRLAMSHVAHTPEAVEKWSQYIQAKFFQSGRPLPQPTSTPYLENSQGSSPMERSAPIPALDGSLSLGSASDWRNPEVELSFEMPSAQLFKDNWSLLNLSHQIHMEKTISSNYHLEQVELWKLAHDLRTRFWLTFDQSNTVSPQSSSSQSSSSVVSSQNHSTGSCFEHESDYHDLEGQEPKDLSNSIFLKELSSIKTKPALAEESSTTVSDTLPSTMNKAGQMMDQDEVFGFSTKVSHRIEVPPVELEEIYWLRTVPARCNLSDFFRGQKKQARSREEENMSNRSPVLKRFKRV